MIINDLKKTSIAKTVANKQRILLVNNYNVLNRIKNNIYKEQLRHITSLLYSIYHVNPNLDSLCI